MDLDPAYIAQCAPGVAPQTIQAIVRVESGGDPLALGVNGPVGRIVPGDPAQAVRLARRFIEAGYSVDLGLMQINSRNLEGLGLSLEQAFEPCTNLRAGALILTRFYATASAAYGEGQRALHAALSAYNTGAFEAGFRNGYMAHYLDRSSDAAALPDPFTADTRIPLALPTGESKKTARRDLTSNPYTADTQVPLLDRRNDHADTDPRHPAPSGPDAGS